jgi:hypothetical protein
VASPAALAAVDKLRPPAGDASVLKGVARLDASYIVAAGAGNIISGNGSAIVAAGGGNIISGNGSAVLANAGGQIVASGAGNVISGNGSAIISGNGSAIVAQGGGNIVASGAGNIVASGAGNRRLLAAGDDARVPVAGMPLGVYSLTDHQPVPVGVDKDGKPVYTVYTNQAGGFELYLPKEKAGNVLVVAQVKPEATDPRLAYGFVAESGTGEELSLDEDTAVLTTYFRRGLGPFLAQGMLENDVEKVESQYLDTKGLPATLKLVIDKQFKELRAAAKLVNVDSAPEQEVKDLVQRMVDAMVAHFYLGTDPAKQPIILTRSPSCNYWHGPDEPAMPAMADLMRILRVKVRAKLAADPSYFDNTDYVRTVNAIRRSEGKPEYRIQKDTDLNNLVVTEYFAESNELRWKQKGSCHDGAHYLWGMLDWIFSDLDMQVVDHVISLDFKGLDQSMVPYTSDRFGQSDRAEEAFHAILARGFLMLNDDTPTPSGKTVHDEVFGILAAFKPSGALRASPTAPPSPDLPCSTPRPVPSMPKPVHSDDGCKSLI